MTDREDSLLTKYAKCSKNPVIIAGGYLRDTILGKPIKDIDVFSTTHIGSIDFISHYTKIEPCKRYEGSNILDVYQHKVTRINYIQVNTLDGFLNNFDIGLCRIYYNISADFLRTSQDFEQDVRNKTITLLKPSHGDHLERVCAKYPDYKVIRGDF